VIIAVGVLVVGAILVRSWTRRWPNCCSSRSAS